MCSDLTAPIQHTKQKTILVHGTFAPNSPWTLPNHDLRKLLERNVEPTSVVRFVWSGENSHKARLKAASELEAFISQMPTEETLHLNFIAHSHGGNVVQYAMRNEDINLRTKRVCLVATPFLHIRKPDVGHKIKTLVNTLGWALFFPGTFFLMIFLISLMTSIPIQFYEDYPAFNYIIPIFIFVVVPGIMSIYALWGPRKRICKTVNDKITQRLLRHREKLHKELVTKPLDTRFLNINSSLDEANLLLRSAGLLGTLQSFFWDVILRCLLYLIPISYLLNVLSNVSESPYILDGSYTPAAYRELAYFQVGLYAIFGYPIAVLISYIVPALAGAALIGSRISLAMPNFWSAFVLRIWSERTPPNVAREGTFVLNVPIQFYGLLQHTSFFSNRDVQKEVVRFVSSDDDRIEAAFVQSSFEPKRVSQAESTVSEKDAAQDGRLAIKRFVSISLAFCFMVFVTIWAREFVSYFDLSDWDIKYRLDLH